MKEVGDYCGWIETEEESTLKNHLRWARIKVKGSPELIPRTMEIQHEGYHYTLLLWAETPARVRKSSSGNSIAEAGTSRSVAEPRARDVQFLGRDSCLNFKNLPRGEKTAGTCKLKEFQLGQTTTTVGPALSPIIKAPNNPSIRTKKPSLENLEPTIMFK